MRFPEVPYILPSKALDDLSSGIADRHPDPRSEHCEGVGTVDVVVYYPPTASESTPHGTTAGPQTSLWQKLRMALKLETLLVKRLFTGPSQAFANVERSQPD